MTIGEFAERVYLYCSVLGGSTTSWIRTEKHNQRVKGHPRSLHRVGLGCDVIYDATPERELRVQWADRLGLQVVMEGDHDHLQVPRR